MILTGIEIIRMRDQNSITIDPFDSAQVNPNSYNYRLGSKLGVPEVDADGNVRFSFIEIPKEGYVISPMTMYLGHTYETLGSNRFAMSLIGRSSLGRLGLFLQVSANLGHTGACHRWTLEIVSAKHFILYPYMRIGQISFWENQGDVQEYSAGYSAFNDPTQSTLHCEGATL